MNYFYGMMGYGAGYGWLTTLLLWIVMGLGIAALLKYLSKK
ncbi:MAG: hypothetical protein WC892_02190 [Patescibacteria group bacterium]